MIEVIQAHPPNWPYLWLAQWEWRHDKPRLRITKHDPTVPTFIDLAVEQFRQYGW